MGLYEEMMETAQNAGLNVLSRHHAAQLLAVVYLYGDETGVYSDKMRADIRSAQDRFGFKGPGSVDMSFVKLVSRYAREIRESETDGKPEWLGDLEERYGVEYPVWVEYRRPPLKRAKDNRALKKLEKYLDIWFDGKQVNGLYMPPESVRRCQEVYNEIAKGRDVSFFGADIKNALEMCGFETVADDVGWRVVLGK